MGFSTTAEWKTANVFQGYNTVLFTNGSKIVFGVGVGDFLDTHSVTKSYGLPEFTSVF